MKRMCGIERFGGGKAVATTRVMSAADVATVRVWSANGAVLCQPGATPRVHARQTSQGPTARSIGGFDAAWVGVRGEWAGPLALDMFLGRLPGPMAQAGMAARRWRWGGRLIRGIEQTIACNVAEILEA